jgi:hypothetical protein
MLYHVIVKQFLQFQQTKRQQISNFNLCLIDLLKLKS